MKLRKPPIGAVGIAALLAIACCVAGWQFFKTTILVRSSSPLHAPIWRMWQEGGWSRSAIQDEVKQLILTEIAIGDPRTKVESHIKRHFRMPDLREKFPMMPPFDPDYSVVAIHDQDLVGLSEIRIRYWFQANHLIKIDIDPYSVGL